MSRSFEFVSRLRVSAIDSHVSSATRPSILNYSMAIEGAIARSQIARSAFYVKKQAITIAIGYYSQSTIEGIECVRVRVKIERDDRTEFGRCTDAKIFTLLFSSKIFSKIFIF